MGLPAARIGDNCSGHPCPPPPAIPSGSAPPAPALTGSTDVLINGLGAVTFGSIYTPHKCSNESSPHTRTVTGGSPTVFVNGKAMARSLDTISCGSTVVGGSTNVFVGP